MIRDYGRERRFTIALATAVAGTLVLSAATAVALRAYGVGTVRLGHAAIAGTTATTTTGPGSAGSSGKSGSGGAVATVR